MPAMRRSVLATAITPIVALCDDPPAGNQFWKTRARRTA